MKDVLVSFAIAFVLTAFSYGLGIQLDWIKDIPWLEAASVFTSYSCTYLCVRESQWNFPIGIVSVALLGILFFDIKLYSSAILSLYLIPVLIIGWRMWRKGGEDKLIVTTIQWNIKDTALWTLMVGGTYLALWGATSLVGASLSMTDSAILVLSILAQYLLTAKKIESWFVWVAVNVLAIYTYLTAEAYLVGVQYVLFLLNTMYGYYTWKGSMQNV